MSMELYAKLAQWFVLGRITYSLTYPLGEAIGFANMRGPGVAVNNFVQWCLVDCVFCGGPSLLPLMLSIC